MQIKSKNAPGIRTEQAALGESVEGLPKALYPEPQISVPAVTAEAC